MGEYVCMCCQLCFVKVVDGEQGGVLEVVDWKGGGGFCFYKLGVLVFDDEGYICDGIKFEYLVVYVWFVEIGVVCFV